MLRSLGIARHLLEASGSLAQCLPVGACGTQMQIVRHAAAKGKKQAGKGGQQAKGKKGAPTTSKKSRMRMESKPFNDKDPLNQRLIAMLAPAATGRPAGAAAAAPAEEDAEAQQRLKEFTRQRMREYVAWRRDLHNKLRLKQAALAALPPELRAAAAEEDTTPFPLTRHFLYDSPPEAYRD